MLVIGGDDDGRGNERMDGMDGREDGRMAMRVVGMLCGGGGAPHATFQAPISLVLTVRGATAAPPRVSLRRSCSRRLPRSACHSPFPRPLQPPTVSHASQRAV